jgi:hypothetical protein
MRRCVWPIQPEEMEQSIGGGAPAASFYDLSSRHNKRSSG